MACLLCGGISLGKRCQRCRDSIREALHVPKKRKRKRNEKQTQAQPTITAEPESAQPADVLQGSETLPNEWGIRGLRDGSVAEREAPVIERSRRPTWEPEPEVEENPFADKDELQRGYLLRQGQPRRKMFR